MRWVDVVDEAIASALSRPLRAALTATGTAVGIGALVATLGLADTAGRQILARFDALEATAVVLAPRPSSGDSAISVPPLPLGADARLERLNGVEGAGSVSEIEGLIATGGISDPHAPPQQRVVAASPGLLAAARGTMLEGRWIDRFHDAGRLPVAVLGPGAVARLGIRRVEAQPSVLLDGTPFTVIGILGEVERATELLDAVIIPEGTAAHRYGLPGPDRILVETVLGSAPLIAGQAPLALIPTDPEAVVVHAPPDLRALRADAEGDVNALFLLLAGVVLGVGALGIANVTLVSVYERRGEIGLRRALGGTRAQVAAQLLLETGVLGLLGGLVGMSGGTLVVLGAAAARDWSPVLDVRLCAAGPVLGAIVGLLAGVHPARRAGAVEPARAVREALG